jgi:hypothetical protein
MAFVNANHKVFLKHFNDYHRKNMAGLYEYDNIDNDVGDLLDNCPFAAACNIAQSTRLHKRKFVKMEQLMKSSERSNDSSNDKDDDEVNVSNASIIDTNCHNHIRLQEICQTLADDPSLYNLLDYFVYRQNILMKKEIKD